MHTPSLLKLYIGGKTNICNETISQVNNIRHKCFISIVTKCSLLFQIISLNPLKNLEEIEICEGDNLNRDTLEMLLNNCTNLRYVFTLSVCIGANIIVPLF